MAIEGSPRKRLAHGSYRPHGIKVLALVVVGVAALAVLSMVVNNGRVVLHAGLESARSEGAGSFGAGCRALPEDASEGSAESVAHVPLGWALRGGLVHELEADALYVVEAPEAGVTGWSAAAATVSDSAGRTMGEAVWLSPSSKFAEFSLLDAGGPELWSPEAVAIWRDDPTQTPERTHLYSLDDFTASVSVWREASTAHQDLPGLEEAARQARRCAVDG